MSFPTLEAVQAAFRRRSRLWVSLSLILLQCLARSHSSGVGGEKYHLHFSDDAHALEEAEAGLERVKRQSQLGAQGLWKDFNLPPFWEQYKSGPYGVVIRGWQYGKCAAEAWHNYAINVTNLVIHPQYPRFPGPIYFNFTVDVKENLPTDNLEIEMEVRHAVLNSANEKTWQVIPCNGWDILTGCGGIGSCRYCDVLQKCKEAVVKGRKYTNDPDIRKILDEPSRLCPPPKGEWTITFNHVIKLEDIPDGFFGPLQSNEYWFTFTLTNGRGRPLACARVWMDICKYHWYDRQQRCLRDPNAFQNFLSRGGA